MKNEEGKHKGCGILNFTNEITAKTVLEYCGENVIFNKQIVLSPFTKSPSNFNRKVNYSFPIVFLLKYF